MILWFLCMVDFHLNPQHLEPGRECCILHLDDIFHSLYHPPGEIHKHDLLQHISPLFKKLHDFLPILVTNYGINSLYLIYTQVFIAQRRLI